MLFMKENREKVMQESTLKESAAINQILGRKVNHMLNFPLKFIVQVTMSKKSVQHIAI